MPGRLRGRTGSGSPHAERRRLAPSREREVAVMRVIETWEALTGEGGGLTMRKSARAEQAEGRSATVDACDASGTCNAPSALKVPDLRRRLAGSCAWLDSPENIVHRFFRNPMGQREPQVIAQEAVCGHPLSVVKDAFGPGADLNHFVADFFDLPVALPQLGEQALILTEGNFPDSCSAAFRAVISFTWEINTSGCPESSRTRATCSSTQMICPLRWK